MLRNNALVFLLLLSSYGICKALIVRDRSTGAEIARFISPLLSQYVGPKFENCSTNATSLVPVGVPSDQHLCDVLSSERTAAIEGKIVLVNDVFVSNPGKCSPEQMLRNAAAAGAKALVSVVTRDYVGRAIAYKGTGEPSNEGFISFITVGKAFIANMSFDVASGNVSSDYVIDVTCDTSQYEFSVYFIGPVLFTLLGCFSLKTSFQAFTGVLHYRSLKNRQVTQPVILTVLFIMLFIDGVMLVFGLLGWTTHSYIVGNEIATYKVKTCIANALMSVNLMAALWTGIFWSLLQRKMLKLSTASSTATNIFTEAPFRTFSAFLFTVPAEVYMNVSLMRYDFKLNVFFAPVMTLGTLCCGFYFYRQVTNFFKATGFEKHSGIQANNSSSIFPSRKTDSSNPPTSTGAMKVPPFMVKLARALRRFSLFLFMQIGAIFTVFGAQLNTNPYGQNVASFIFASGTFGMAYYLVQGFMPSAEGKNALKKSKLRSNRSSKNSSVNASLTQSRQVGSLNPVQEIET